jgi:hypothetical protein
MKLTDLDSTTYSTTYSTLISPYLPSLRGTISSFFLFIPSGIYRILPRTCRPLDDTHRFREHILLFPCPAFEKDNPDEAGVFFHNTLNLLSVLAESSRWLEIEYFRSCPSFESRVIERTHPRHLYRLVPIPTGRIQRGRMASRCQLHHQASNNTRRP